MHHFFVQFVKERAVCTWELVLMGEILHQLIGSLSHGGSPAPVDR